VAGVPYDVEGDPRKLDGGIYPAGDQQATRGAASRLPDGNPDVRAALEAASLSRGAHLTLLDGNNVEIQGDPTDAALLMMSRRVDIGCDARVLGEQPFTSARRMASVLVAVDGQIRAYVRGAPEALLERSTNLIRDGRSVPLESADRDAFSDEAASWAARSM